ncbi:MAG TPA: FAD-dependent monooxygenase [Kofleriaceae bacterium]|nr:FAD-dependent monooxygenase [Kofleriaceae bacterium]
MNVIVVGGGPAGLYLGLLLRSASRAIQVTVLEKLRPPKQTGFGVVLSDRTVAGLKAAHRSSHAAIAPALFHWDDIDIHVGGHCVRSSGHGFAGISRARLLAILRRQCEARGVQVCLGERATDLVTLAKSTDLLVGADGVASTVRRAFGRAFEPRIHHGENRFIWLGTTVPFSAFTFFFKPTQHGLFWAHAYRYAPGSSTFIVECSGETWRRARLCGATQGDSIGFLRTIFADELSGHRLVGNRSGWRRFPTVTARRWKSRNVVLIGDAAHTAHFSIGAGTRLAMGDAICLSRALLSGGDIESILERYEDSRRPQIEAVQEKAAVSESWFERAERHVAAAPADAARSLLLRADVPHEPAIAASM